VSEQLVPLTSKLLVLDVSVLEEIGSLGVVAAGIGTVEVGTVGVVAVSVVTAIVGSFGSIGNDSFGTWFC
jgi:hypothetical protein